MPYKAEYNGIIACALATKRDGRVVLPGKPCNSWHWPCRYPFSAGGGVGGRRKRESETHVVNNADLPFLLTVPTQTDAIHDPWRIIMHVHIHVKVL